MAEYIAASAAVLMVPSIKGFKEKLKTALSTVDESVPIGVTLNKDAVAKVEAEIAALKKAAEQDPIKVKTKVDSDAIKKDLDKFKNDIEQTGAGLKKGFVLNIQVVGLSLLPQVVSALAAVDQSIVELSSNALLLPGILAGAASAFGTLLVGITGVKSAFSAYSTAVKDSVNDAQRATDAQRSLTNANRDLTTAQRDSKRSLEDLNQQMRGAPLDEASAVLDLRDAQNQLADSFGKTGLQRQRDQIAYERAVQNLDNVRVKNVRTAQDVAAANKAGVNGSPAVLDALDKQAKAQEAVSNAAKGNIGVQAALAKLSPNAQDFVTKLHSMAGAFKDFRNSVQDKLFVGLGDQVVQLGSKLPVVQKGFDGIATSMNGLFKEVLSQAGSAGNVNFLDRIFGNTAGGVANLKGSVQPLLDVFLRLGAVGSQFLPQLADGFTTLLNRLDAFITKADKDGSLQTWIKNGIRAAKDLGDSFVNIGKIMGDVAKAFSEGGNGGFLGAVDRVTKKLADFFGSDKGQDKMLTFFHDGRVALAQWEPIFKDVVSALKNVLTGSQDWSLSLLPFLRTAAELLGHHPALVQTILTAYLSWRTISPIIKGVVTVLDADSGMLGALKKVIKAVGEGEGFKGKLGVLASFISPGGVLMVAVTALVAYIGGNFITAFTEGDTALANMKTKADELKNSLDDVTGAATKASTAVVSNQFQNANNSATGQDYGNLRDAAKDHGIDPGKLFPAIASGDKNTVDALLGPTKSITRDAVEKSDFYKAHAESLKSIGGLDTVVNALNGEPDAVKTFQRWSDDNATDNITGAAVRKGQSHEVLRGLEKSQLIDIPDLKDLQDSLPADVQKGAEVTQQATSALNDSISGRKTVTDTNSDKNGTATLNPTGLAIFGPGAKVGNTDNGGVSIYVPGPPNAKLEKDVQANNGQVDNTTVGGTTYTLDKSRAALYVQGGAGGAGGLGSGIPGFSGGGMAWGAGSGTSDSILARVSNGEFITKADQVAKNPALFHGLNSGAIDPRSLPHFDGGGGLTPDLIDQFRNRPGSLTVSGQGTAKNAVQAPAVTFSESGRTLPVNDVHLNPAPHLSPQAQGFINSAAGLQGFNPGAPKASGSSNAALDALGIKGAPLVQGPGTPTAVKPSGSSPWTWGGSKGKPAAPGLFSPENTNPALINPAAPAKTGTKSSALTWGGKPGANPGLNNPPGGGVPANADHLPSGAVDGIPTLPGPPTTSAAPAPLASVVPGATDDKLANLPQNLQPVGLLESIGSIFLDAILGFFGISPTYINTIKQGLGLFGKGDQRADPTVSSILGGQPGVDAQFGPLTGQQGTFAAPSAGAVPSGAVARATAMAEQMKGKMYTWGGNTLDGTDCSGLVMYVVDALNGLPFSGRSGGTGTFGTTLPAKGAIVVSDPSQLPPGTLQIGWNSHHTSGTLPDGRGFEANDFGQPIHLGPGAGGAKEAGFTNWAYFPVPAAATGGMLSGPGSGTSDSILARVSNGEFITKASVVAKNPELFHKLNSGAIDPRSLAHFAIGGEAGADSPYKKIDGTIDTRKIGTPGGWTGPKPAAAPGAQLPGVDKTRAGLGAPPASSDHVLPAVSEGISGAAAAIGNAASLAASAATFGAGGLGGASVSGAGAGAGAAGAGGGGGGGGATASFIGGATQIGAGIAKGLFNIGSSLLVGTATPGTTAGAYGSPLTPQKNQQPVQGPQINNTYGDIHTASYDEFYKGQQRREAQQQAPFIGSLGKG